MSRATNAEKKRSLGSLLGAVPGLIVSLFKLEMASLKEEIGGKVAKLGIGIGLLVGVLILLPFLVGVLLAAAIMGLAVVFPGWLSALIVGGGILIIMAVLVFMGLRFIKKSTPLSPTKTIASIKEDIHAIKGVGIYDEY